VIQILTSWLWFQPHLVLLVQRGEAGSVAFRELVAVAEEGQEVLDFLPSVASPVRAASAAHQHLDSVGFPEGAPSVAIPGSGTVDLAASVVLLEHQDQEGAIVVILVTLAWMAHSQPVGSAVTAVSPAAVDSLDSLAAAFPVLAPTADSRASRSLVSVDSLG